MGRLAKISVKTKRLNKRGEWDGKIDLREWRHKEYVVEHFEQYRRRCDERVRKGIHVHFHLQDESPVVEGLYLNGTTVAPIIAVVKPKRTVGVPPKSSTNRGRDQLVD